MSYLGRDGSMNKNELILEQHWFKPYVKPVVSVNINAAENKITPIIGRFVRESRSSLSGRDIGYKTWMLAPDQIYFVGNVQGTSQRNYSYYVIYDSSQDKEYCYEYFDDLIDDYFKSAKDELFLKRAEYVRERDALAARKASYSVIANGIVSNIIKQRAEFPSVVEDGVEAVPEFLAIPAMDVLIEKMVAPNFDAEQFEMTCVAPSYYIVSYPFVKAATAEEAISQAKNLAKQRADQLEVAAKMAEESGLPLLSGTEKMINWALQIRAKAQQLNSSDPALKKATTAKYWIENRRKYDYQTPYLG